MHCNVIRGELNYIISLFRINLKVLECYKFPIIGVILSIHEGVDKVQIALLNACGSFHNLRELIEFKMFKIIQSKVVGREQSITGRKTGSQLNFKCQELHKLRQTHKMNHFETILIKRF